MSFVNNKKANVAIWHLSLEKQGRIMYYLVMDKSEGMPIDMERVEERMRAEGITTQAELARRAGLLPSTVSRLFKKNGRRAGSADTLAALAAALKTTVDYLRGTTHDPRRSESEPLPDYAVEIIEAMKRIDKSQRYELMVIAKAFAATASESAELRREDFISLVQDMADEMGAADEARP